MARCILDFSHPYFQCTIRSLGAGHPDFHEGLEKAKRKIEAEHTSCGCVIQEMPKNPDCNRKIWKNDWSPPSTKSSRSGRKSWRLVVIVPDPNTQPYRLIAGFAYPKSTTSQLTTDQLIAIFSEITATRPENTRVGDIATQEPEYCPLCHQEIAFREEVTQMVSGLSAHATCYAQRIGPK